MPQMTAVFLLFDLIPARYLPLAASSRSPFSAPQKNARRLNPRRLFAAPQIAESSPPDLRASAPRPISARGLGAPSSEIVVPSSALRFFVSLVFSRSDDALL